MRRLIGLLAAALAAALAVAQPITDEQKADVLKAVEDTVTTRAFVPGMDFSKWAGFIAKQKDAVDAAKDIPSFTSAVNRALREFGASHIRLTTPQAAERRTQTTTIGVGVSVRRQDEGLVVSNVMDNGPAKEAGLKPGDIILEVDGKPVSDQTTLEGDEGTKVSLKVKREDGKIVEVQVERRRFSTVRPETLTWVDGETAVLKVFTFNVGYGRENVAKLMGEAAKAKRLIVDLRNNGGGAVNNLNQFLSHLMPPETVIGTFVSRQLADRYTRETGKDATDVKAIAEWSTQKSTTRKQPIEHFKGDIAVLVNRGSASASEIAASALREQRNAVIVGTNTAGAVLASVFGRLPHGFQLQYPVNDYVTAKGIRLEKNPVVPDAEVTRTGTPDPAVEKAVELLRTRTLIPEWLIAA